MKSYSKAKANNILGQFRMRLVAYCRVSTEGQSDNTSIQDQKDKVIGYCKGMGHELVAVLEEVGSAKNKSGRPIFNQALDLLKVGAADGLIAAKLDRVARNTLDVLELVRDVLQPLEKALILLDLNVDTSTPTGKMVLTVMSGVAELERALITERTQTGRKNKAAKGGYAYGSPAFGMMSDENNELTPNLDEQEVIGIIRRHRKSGKSFDRIAQYLNDQGIQTKRGGQWLGRTVYNIYQKIEIK